MEPARDLLAAAVDLQPETIALRRMLHRRPEVGLSLPETQAAILTAIDGLPLKVTKGRQVSSVVGVLEAGGPGRPCCCAATWTRCRCPRTPASTMPPRCPG